MNTPEGPSEPSKYAWSRITGRDLPKRAAGERSADFHEAHLPFDEATAREQASRCIQCPHPGCVLQCPVGSPIQEWLQLTAEGKFSEAAEVSRRASAIPDICARICPKDHFCEEACVLNGPSEAVSIGAIEEFLEDRALARGETEATVAPPTGRRVAVVGTGPAGLACAEVLSRRGYAVTLFDEGEVAGGWLVHGTSPIRLDRTIVQRRVDLLRRRGAVFRLGMMPGRDFSLAGLRGDFDAVFVGPDARTAHALSVPGADLPGIVSGLDFIQTRPGDANGSAVAGRRVLVTGDDDTALDCVRTAIRRGAREVVGLCPHAEGVLPWCRREFDDAVEEGAHFLFEVAPVEVFRGADGRVSGVRVARTQPGDAEPSEPYSWVAVPGTEQDLEAECLVVALGFDPLPAPLPGDFGALVTRGGRVEVDARQMTAVPGVFAGGDVVRGPCLAVQAMHDAAAAADGIEAFLAERGGPTGPA